MADLAVVALGLDTTGMKRGEQEVTRTLDKIRSEFDQAKAKATELQTRLNQSGASAGQGFKAASQSAGQLGSALSGLGGPVGQMAGQMQNLASQAGELISSFGVMGGSLIGIGAAAATAAASLVKLTLEGVKLSDQMLDISEATRLSLDQVQRLSAAFGLAGEDVGQVERAFMQYQSTVVEAARGSEKAQQALKDMGVDGKKAANDIAGSFVETLSRLGEIRSTLSGAQASNEAFGRSAGALARISGDLGTVLGATTEQLERWHLIAGKDAVEAGGRLDKQINALSYSWGIFTQNLAASSTGKALEAFFDDFNRRLRESHGLWDLFVTGLRSVSLSNVNQMVLNAGATERQRQWQGLFDLGQPRVTAETRIWPTDITDRTKSPKAPGGRSVAEKLAEEALRAEEKFQREYMQIIQDGINTRKKLFEETTIASMFAISKGLNEAIVDATSPIGRIENLGKAIEKITKGVPLALPPGLSPVQQGGPGQPFPGAPIFTGMPAPDTIRTYEQARLDDQFSLIFDDFLVSILTAQKTLSQAFGGLALGIADQFAIEFTKAFRESFITPVVQGLTDLLNDALKTIFGGLSTGGVKGVFGGILKGIGTIFGGFFEAGGVLPANQLGVVGERGPELIFSGARPLTVAPTGIGGGNAYTFNFAITTPSGQIDRRSQDQMAASVLSAVRRAQRNEGVR